MNSSIRNIAIIAHVDHGKTTLVDNMLKQSGTFRDNQQVAERVMDSNDLEKERGITILAKCTSLNWQGTRINVVDTPGHADFGGEVERILTMVDGVVLLVDSAEGPMPQTKFVLGKALKLGLKPIVVINKIDRSDARQEEVLDEIFELFISLDANDEQADFPVLYAAGRDGWAVRDLIKDPRENLHALFDIVLEYFAEPQSNVEAPFSMIATTREYDQYLGRILTGRIETGVIKVNMPVKSMDASGRLIENGRIAKLLSFRGLERIAINEAHAGDIVAIAGLSKTNVADTIGTLELEIPLQAQPIDPPTLAMNFAINNSPLAGKEGTKLTSPILKERLLREAEGNVAISIKEIEGEAFEVAGRGELQIGVLIETMRREGFEMTVSRPRVIYQNDPVTGNRLEPHEEIQIDVDDMYVGTVIESMNARKAEMLDMKPSGGGKTRIIMVGPSRGLIGYHGIFLTETRGTGIMSRIFHSYAPYKGPIEGRRNGVLISTGNGDAVAYALFNLEDRGDMFINSGVPVYQGMIIGEHNKDNDLSVNPLKAKQLSNVRASGKDKAIKLKPSRLMSLEQTIAYIQDDERVEVTPRSIRIRKAHLDPNERKKMTSNY